MKFSEIFRAGRFVLSFELFPPKTAAGEVALDRHVAQLAEFKPDLITCTYGAGGKRSSRSATRGGRADRPGCAGRALRGRRRTR
jgi:methylenetetrahydrofolate reductase (NADPH)